MRLKGIVIIPRKDQVFRTAETIVVKTKGFRGFAMDQVPAYYRKENPVDGYAVALILDPSPADVDFQVPILFLGEIELRIIKEALDRSDDLTHKLLGRGWNGSRPFYKVEDFI